MTQKEVAISAMKSLDIYAPYINKFEKDGTATLFERFGGYYIEKDNEPELLKKIKEVEEETGAIVYAVTHTITSDGEMYELLCISEHEEEWEDILNWIKKGYAFSYVWNKSYDYDSEFGDIVVKSFGGGIARVG
jgi:uncharacterized protein YrzB (UPF0473 family)